jgi:GT2 family glycosyltransferase
MVVFVILHYKNINDTLECIESLKELKGRKKIIVVDNNSLTIEEQEALKSKVDNLLLLDKNYGFAKANNQGIKLACEEYKPEFVVAINNDVIIYEQDFIDKIKSDYKKYNFDLLGTKIISPGDSYNPFPVFKNKEEVETEIKYCKKLIKIYSNNLLYVLLKLYLKIKHFIRTPKKIENGKKLKKNVALHGCAIIFSKKYLEKYEYAFYNETFLYHEEEFLYRRIIDDKLISIYDPNIEIYHKEGSSLNKIIKNERNKKLFKEKERLKSLELYVRVVSKNEKI